MLTWVHFGADGLEPHLHLLIVLEKLRVRPELSYSVQLKVTLDT